jgi:uncharacterized protein (TIGR03083 family)
MDPTTIDPSVPELITTWRSAIQDMVELSETLSDSEWNKPTPCPGWNVADVVAHTADIESLMAGEARPEHEVDWDALPHAASAFGRFAEVGVDYRRGRGKGEMLAELETRADSRRAQLNALPSDAEVIGVTGKLVPISRMLRTRIFDIWAHEQDIRSAVAKDGHWSTAPAVISFQQMVTALPYVWSKGVGAPAGSVVRVTVTGPELESDLYAVIDAAGRGVAGAPTSEVDLHLTVSWPDYTGLSCGRLAIDDPKLRDRITLTGDPELGERLLGEMAITP